MKYDKKNNFLNNDPASTIIDDSAIRAGKALISLGIYTPWIFFLLKIAVIFFPGFFF